MAYNVSYTTLPTFTTNSIGYIINQVRYSAVNTWQSVPVTDAPITLTPGIYTITANISYLASPNSYAYILLDNSSNNSIFFDGSKYNSFTSFTSYQSSNPSTGGDWSFYTSNSNWYPVAGQQMRNGVSGSSSALSLSCTVQITSNTCCACIAYSAGSSITCNTIKIVRIS
jgi:hypothetical protein